MEERSGETIKTFVPRVAIDILGSAEELALFQRAAEIAGGTMIEVLPSDPAAVELYLEGVNPSDYLDFDIVAYAQESLGTGAIFVRVTEDTEVRNKKPGDVWNAHLLLQKGILR